MNRFSKLWIKASFLQLLLLSIIIFWGSVFLICFIDFIGETFFHVTWPSGPDLFPNQILGYPLAMLQFVSLGFLLGAGSKCFLSDMTLTRRMFFAIIVIFTGLFCLGAYVVMAFWYQFDFMARSM
ncbi:hypothetical protein HOH87_00750 [bacterium]|jgi:hypothetical protein|nr:hypothetical protein [bacterium]